MIRSASVASAWVLIAATALAAQQPPTSAHFQIERLADGVWAAIAADSGYAISNAGIIDLGDATVVFDAFISPEPAEDLRGAAEALTGRSVDYVVLSHGHNDHIRGAQAFPNASVIGTEGTRRMIVEREPETIAREREHISDWLERARRSLDAETDPERRPEGRFWVAYYEAIARSVPSLVTALPQTTFQGRLVLHGTERRVELIETGRGHTESDLVLHVPEQKIAFLGDLLFIERHPYLPDGFPDDWVRVLRRVEALDPARVVPGHGPVGGPDALATMAAYIEDLRTLGAGLARAGASEDDAARTPIPERYADWWYGRFFPANVRFMHRRAAEATDGDAHPGRGAKPIDGNSVP